MQEHMVLTVQNPMGVPWISPKPFQDGMVSYASEQTMEYPCRASISMISLMQGVDSCGCSTPIRALQNPAKSTELQQTPRDDHGTAKVSSRSPVSVSGPASADLKKLIFADPKILESNNLDRPTPNPIMWQIHYQTIPNIYIYIYIYIYVCINICQDIYIYIYIRTYTCLIWYNHI